MGLTGTNRTARLAAGMALVMVAGLASGCMGSPTYGTDKTANAQLASDLGGIFSFSPKKKPHIDYQPRPELVKPAKGDEALPPPQDSIAANNPQWPESPEQRLARVRADADANVDNPFYKSPVVADTAQDPQARSAKAGSGNGRADESGVRDVTTMAAEKAEFQARLKANQQGESTRRAYLSEPPLDYRQASAEAPQGEIGEDEDDKERRLKRAARKKDGGFSLSDLNPF